MALVLDASVTMAWCFRDETALLAEAAFDRLAREPAFVPAVWWYEVRNVLLVAERRGRIAVPDSAQFLADLALLPVRVEPESDDGAVMGLARSHGLSIYDASYLELARRLDAPLATLDRRLALAARRGGIALLDE